MKNSEDLEMRKKRLAEEKAAVDETIELKQQAAKKDAENIRLLKNLGDKYSFLSEMYNDATTEIADSLPIRDYLRFVSPLRDVRPVGVSAVCIRDESRRNLSDSSRHYTVINTAGTTASSAASGLVLFSRENPQWFPNSERIIDEFKPRDELAEQIEYIRSQLPKITLDIRRDFNAFIDGFYLSTPDETKYQELIGGRSMFFIKLIDGFVEKQFGRVEKRKDRIAKFVFGNTQPTKEGEAYIDSAKALWDDLSSQDREAESVKTGKASAAYIEVLFRRMIAVMASLLRLRQSLFSG
jgi:hypothetical protein